MVRSRIVQIFTALEHARVYAANSHQAHTKKHHVAVVLHLYYPEMWEYFRTKLSQLDAPFDLFVTIPIARKHDTPKDLLDDPAITVFYVPNRGRDVLPFFYVMKRLKGSNYKAILKIHSKKSPHYEKGSQWLDDMVETLVATPVDTVLTILGESATIIGPAGYYYSLEVNYEANASHLSSVLKKLGIRSTRIEKITKFDRPAYGFFAGTMFWVSPAVAATLSKKLHIRDFEVEQAQIDGTLAHAVERTFTILPEAQNVPIYTTNGNGIEVTKYETGVIPEWSDKYKG